MVLVNEHEISLAACKGYCRVNRLRSLSVDVLQIWSVRTFSAWQMCSRNVVTNHARRQTTLKSVKYHLTIMGFSVDGTSQTEHAFISHFIHITDQENALFHYVLVNISCCSLMQGLKCGLVLLAEEPHGDK